MTKVELAAQTVWEDYDLGNLSLFIPLFDESIKMILVSMESFEAGLTKMNYTSTKRDSKYANSLFI